MPASGQFHPLEEPVNTLRMIMVIALAIVLAAVAIKILAIVTAIIFKLVTLALFVGVLYVLFLIARSALRDRNRRVTP